MEDMKKQSEEMKKQNDEMRKLKAIIVKHENRIRALEAEKKARDEDVLDTILTSTDAPTAKKLSTNDNIDAVAPVVQLAADEV